jgi:hypothetical protein
VYAIVRDTGCELRPAGLRRRLLLLVSLSAELDWATRLLVAAPAIEGPCGSAPRLAFDRQPILAQKRVQPAGVIPELLAGIVLLHLSSCRRAVRARGAYPSNPLSLASFGGLYCMPNTAQNERPVATHAPGATDVPHIASPPPATVRTDTVPSGSPSGPGVSTIACHLGSPCAILGVNELTAGPIGSFNATTGTDMGPYRKSRFRRASELHFPAARWESHAPGSPDPLTSLRFGDRRRRRKRQKLLHRTDYALRTPPPRRRGSSPLHTVSVQ